MFLVEFSRVFAELYGSRIHSHKIQFCDVDSNNEMDDDDDVCALTQTSSATVADAYNVGITMAENTQTSPLVYDVAGGITNGFEHTAYSSTGQPFQFHASGQPSTSANLDEMIKQEVSDVSIRYVFF